MHARDMHMFMGLHEEARVDVRSFIAFHLTVLKQGGLLNWWLAFWLGRWTLDLFGSPISAQCWVVVGICSFFYIVPRIQTQVLKLAYALICCSIALIFYVERFILSLQIVVSIREEETS